MTIDESNLKLKINLFLWFNNTMPRSRQTQKSRNQTRIQNIANGSTLCFSITRANRAFYTDALGRNVECIKFGSKNDKCFYLGLFLMFHI